MKNYALKWLTQRITALILIPLTFWFIYSAISLSKMTYYEIEIFFNPILMHSYFL
jgi:succinate dehydrogenase hydrophobic anchor subunit